MALTRESVLSQLIKIGGPNADKLTQSIFAMGMNNAKTADVLAYTAKAFGFTAKYQGVVTDWIKSMAPPAPAPAPVTTPSPASAPSPQPSSGDGDPAHNSDDPNDLDPAHHAPGWTPPASTVPPAPVPTVPVATPANKPETVARFGQNTWLGGWSGNVKDAVSAEVNKSHDDVSVLVEYNIPGRDNGNYSAGGLSGPAEYDAWTKQVATGIGTEPAWVIVEPDAIGLMDGISSEKQTERYAMLQKAVDNYQAAPKTRVYVDLSMWLGVDEAARRISKLRGVHGFSLNVSGYNDLATCLAFGDAVAKITGLHYIVDTSRNGRGNPHPPAWCNVTDTRVGKAASVDTASAWCDAYLWLKVPGESDGLKINGHDQDGKPNRTDVPSAGAPWPEYRDAIYSGDWSAFKAKYRV